jgi:hypothetical protein
MLHGYMILYVPLVLQNVEIYYLFLASSFRWVLRYDGYQTWKKTTNIIKETKENECVYKLSRGVLQTMEIQREFCNVIKHVFRKIKP